jgi:hypothetical protein
MLPRDYKCFCFGGKVRFVQVVNRTAHTVNWYSRDWTPINDSMILSWSPGAIEEPPHVERILNAAECLATGYAAPFVRVDLYTHGGQPVFGEFTHTPQATSSRYKYTPYANRVLGRAWTDAVVSAGAT